MLLFEIFDCEILAGIRYSRIRAGVNLQVGKGAVGKLKNPYLQVAPAQG